LAAFFEIYALSSWPFDHWCCSRDAEDTALRYWLGPKQKSHDDEPVMA